MNLHSRVAILCLIYVTTVNSKGSWSYTNASSSVDKWGKISSRMCDGARQSPIPLHYREATYAPNLYPVSVYQLGKFNKSEYLSVMNTGHTLMVFFPSCHYFMSLNGLRNGEFCIKQFHFHWGTDSTSGSEHSLNGRFFPLEMHIVTYNRHLYDSILEASDKANGLAVVALFFEEKEDVDLKDTQLFKMSAFLRSAEAVQQPNTSVRLVPFPGEALLDIGKDRGRFYRYEGSLTTPPCTENVVWTVMNKVLPVHPQQLEVFRMLRFPSDEVEQRMVNNYRKIQTINPATVLVPRVIFRSWNPASATTTMSAIVCATLFALTIFIISAA